MAAESERLGWGIIGPGNIARAFAGGLAHSRTGKLVAIGTRDATKPGLAENFPGTRVHSGYEALLADPEVEAVYIATPHPFHAEWAIKAARAGKHALVEKPIGLSAFEADAMFHEALKAETFMGEAFMYRAHPQTARLIELVKAGTIGEVRVIKSSFGFAMPKFDSTHRLYANRLGGGAILDVGCYPASMARLIAGAAQGRPFLEPEKVFGVAHLGAEGTDEWSSAVLQFPGGILAEIGCAVSVALDNVLRIIGTEGRIEVPHFWFAGGKEGGTGRIEIFRKDGTHETVEVAEPGWLYSFEADAAAEAIRAGGQQFSPPAMSWADTLGNMRVLDKWRADIGLEYVVEKPALRTRTLAGAGLAAPAAGGIPVRTLAGLTKPTSKVAMGFEAFPSFAAASILLDAFYEKGGNLFDTAWIYRAGKSEGFFGDWHTSRGVPRESFTLIGKGAHAPLCYPDVIGRQLGESLDRLKTDHVDIYFMHRDNPAVPVGEFVDAIDAEVRAGRIRGLAGGSNWTRARMDEAIRYARKNGRTAFGALSNNFALAEMQEPVWAGCIAASDDAWKAWLTERGIPVFAWSSQARGFFTERAGREKFDDKELVRSWYSERNFARRDRAVELGAKLGRSPIHIALAYVLAQPFTVVPLIGPRTLGELEDSLSALDISLTPEDVRWLEA